MIENKGFTFEVITDLNLSKHIDKMNEIEQQGYKNGLSTFFTYQELIEAVDECAYTLGCFHNKEIVGYLMLYKGSPNDIYVYNFMIEKSYQGRGLGTQLLVEADKNFLCKFDDNTPLCLDVETTNPVKKFYAKLGFKPLKQTSPPEFSLGADTLEYSTTLRNFRKCLNKRVLEKSINQNPQI